MVNLVANIFRMKIKAYILLYRLKEVILKFLIKANVTKNFGVYFVFVFLFFFNQESAFLAKSNIEFFFTCSAYHLQSNNES